MKRALSSPLTMTPATIKLVTSLSSSLGQIKKFFTAKNILWQDKAIAVVTALSFSLAIMLKERGVLVGLLLVPLLLFYPYSARDKKNILQQFSSPLYLLLYALVAVFGFSLFWGLAHNTIMPAADYRQAIFYHGWFVLGRTLLLAAIVPSLLWFFKNKPVARDVTLDLLMLVAVLVMLTIVVLVELQLINNGERQGLRSSQYSQNAAILFLLILPLLFKKNGMAWLCLPLVLLLHLRMTTIGGVVVGYTVSRAWTLAMVIGVAIYLLIPRLITLSRNRRIMLWGALVMVYFLYIVGLWLSGVIYDTSDPYNHPLLHFLKSLGFDGNSMKERLKFWHFIDYYIFQHPFVGYGININRYLLTLTSDFSTNILGVPYHAIAGECFLINGFCEALNQPHYIWIEILLDAGLLAPLLLFAFFARGWWQLLVQHNNHPSARAAFTFFTACVFCFIITNSFYAFWQMYMMVMGMLLLLSQTAKNKKS